MDKGIVIMILKIALFIGLCIAGYSAQYIFKEKDTPVEQLAEHLIHEYTGHEIDFTPEEPEVTEEIIEIEGEEWSVQKEEQD